MAYSTVTPPRLLVESIGGNVPNIWVYANTDTAATVYAASYFTNALALGMKVGDLLFYLKSDGPAIYTMVCTAVSSTGSTFGSTNTVTS